MWFMINEGALYIILLGMTPDIKDHPDPDG